MTARLASEKLQSCLQVGWKPEKPEAQHSGFSAGGQFRLVGTAIWALPLGPQDRGGEAEPVKALGFRGCLVRTGLLPDRCWFPTSLGPGWVFGDPLRTKGARSQAGPEQK